MCIRDRGAAAQLGIYSAYFFAILLGFSGKEAACISIIGGADGPTSLFLCSKLGQTQIMGPIAVAAYSYMALVPIIQPPFMKLLTTAVSYTHLIAQSALSAIGLGFGFFEYAIVGLPILIC